MPLRNAETVNPGKKGAADLENKVIPKKSAKAFPNPANNGLKNKPINPMAMNTKLIRIKGVSIEIYRVKMICNAISKPIMLMARVLCLDTGFTPLY